MSLAVLAVPEAPEAAEAAEVAEVAEVVDRRFGSGSEGARVAEVVVGEERSDGGGDTERDGDGELAARASGAAGASGDVSSLMVGWEMR